MWDTLRNTAKPIVLYGMGNGADKIIAEAESRQIPVAGVFASDGFVRSKLFHGFPLLSYAQAKEQFGDMIVLVSFGTHLPEVMEKILAIAREQEVYAPDVPVYGGPLFTREFFEAHQGEYNEILPRMADAQSFSVLENVCKYKLTGKLDYLLACQSDPEEIYKSFLKLSDNEDFVDLGAYRGDTVEEFLHHTGGYHSILALEPDPRSFRHLTENCSSLKNCRLVNGGAYSHNDTLCFAGNVGRGGAVAADGKKTAMYSVDTLLGGRSASYIKIDVEGMEEKAIEGMKETICRYKPKLCVSAYHKSGDLLSLPLQILALQPGYKVYLRHFPCFPAWDVNYYFI